MRHTDGAGHRSEDRRGCLGGTRTEILLQLEDWLEDNQGQRVFWLNGLAGTGKSTIAQTFAEITSGEGKLGASFFCSRGVDDRSNIKAIFPTLAFQLAYRYPEFREQLLQVLRANPGIGQDSLCNQFEKAIVGPFEATQIPTLVIIDALDECKDKEPASVILSILSRYVDKIPSVKFFITGRPEPRIRSGFRLKSLKPITEVFRLHDVKRTSVDGDIKLYFRIRLTEVSATRSDCSFMEEWPSPSDIDILCEKAAGFFIYASTVIEFVASQNHVPTERLACIISLPKSTAQEGKSGIDLLYTQVMEQAFHNVDQNEQKHYKTVFGTVILVLNPLSVRALSELLGVSNLSTTLRSLHSVLLVSDLKKAEDPIRTFHKSFPDFLTDPERCQGKWFFVDSQVHAEIVLSCLRLMKEKLKRNICNMDDYALLSEVGDLATLQKNCIGSALEYACHFWTKHLLEIPSSSSHVEGVQKAIDEFFMTSLLYWIEVLVLTRNLDLGVHAMNDIERWYTSVSVTYTLLKCLLIIV